jgi:hypothetical protein
VVENLVKGLNTTIIIYGDKGTGKTYTVFGTRDDYKVPNEQDGILARLVRESFDGILQLPETIELSIKICSYEVEKSGNQVLDLLSAEESILELKWDEKTNKISIGKVTEEYMVSDEEIFGMLVQSIPIRSEDSTYIFEMSVTQTEGKKIITSKFTIVELPYPKVIHDIVDGTIKQNYAPKTTLEKVIYGLGFVDTKTILLLCCSPLIEDGEKTLKDLNMAFSLTEIKKLQKLYVIEEEKKRVEKKKNFLKS